MYCDDGFFLSELRKFFIKFAIQLKLIPSMKNLRKFIFFLTSVSMMSLASCVNDNLSEPWESDVNKVLASVADQAKAVEGSIEVVEALQDALNAEGVNLSGAVELLGQHVDKLGAGMSLSEGSLATLDLQKQLAAMLGAAQAELYFADVLNQDIQKSFVVVEKSVKSWLGELLVENYPAAIVGAKSAAIAAEFGKRLTDQGLAVDALMSDVEAGLRNDENPAELTELAASVAKASQESETLAGEMVSLASEVEQEYVAAIKALASDPASFKSEAVTELNSKVATKAEESGRSIASLAADVKKCQETLESLEQRLKVLEGNVDELLGMIQSVTFMSQYSTEHAFAYYNMDVNTKVADSNLPYDGKAVRTATGTMELNYLVRPAAASTALNANLDAVKVMGYYANTITPMSVSPLDYIDFEVTKVVATDANRGLVTVTVKPNLKDAFYYKEVGAKCALSVKTGKTDVMSKFVEILPKDNSTTVYVQSVTPSKDVIRMKKGEYAELSATVTPSNATTNGYYLTSSDTKIIRLDENTGKLYAYGVGTANVTVMSKGTDEWGLPVMATCAVEVEEAFMLSGPPYVEVGYTADMFLDYPVSAIIESKVWQSSDPSKAAVDENGKVTGVAHTYNSNTKQYNSVTISCIINGLTTVNWNIFVAATQPKTIDTPALPNGQNEISMRVDESLSLASTISPENVPDGAYRIRYQSDHEKFINYDTGVINEYKNTLSPTSAYVYITVDNKDQDKYMVVGALKKTVIVKVLPYYVKTISFDPVEMQLGQTVTLSPKFTADVDGKVPTNTAVTWSSSNEAIATVDKNGVVTSVAAGIVNITATSTDGSNVSGTCTVSITQPWKSFEVGDFVVRMSNGDIDFAGDINSATSKGSVVGVVIAKTNPRATDSMLPASCTHGVAIALGEGEGKWWSDAPSSSPYKVYEWATQNGYQSTMGVDWSSSKGTHRAGTSDKFVGYNNTLALKAFLSAKGLSSEMISALNAYSGPKLPDGASGYYLPSIAEMDAVAAVSNMGWALSDKIQSAGGTKFTNAAYWTVSDSGNSSSNAAKINPLTGALDGAGMKTNAAKFRYVFAF